MSNKSMKIKTDFLIIGSGFYGSVLAERIANKLNKKVIILEKRKHVGGNCYSEIDKKTNVSRENFCFVVFFKKADRIAIIKSSLLEAITFNTQSA